MIVRTWYDVGSVVQRSKMLKYDSLLPTIGVGITENEPPTRLTWFYKIPPAGYYHTKYFTPHKWLKSYDHEYDKEEHRASSPAAEARPGKKDAESGARRDHLAP